MIAHDPDGRVWWQANKRRANVAEEWRDPTSGTGLLMLKVGVCINSGETMGVCMHVHPCGRK